MFEALGTGLASVPQNDPAPPPLGQLLVERGLVTEEQLQYALAEQGRTGLPIGQVLISLSYVTAATIAQALATQEGGVVRTEFGLSTGFGTPGLVALPPVSPVAPTPFAPVVIAPEPAAELEPEPVPAYEPEPEPALEPELPEPVAVVVAPAPELAPPSSTTTRIAELVEQELANAASAAAEEIAAAHGRIAELEGEMSGLRQQAEAARGAEELLAATNARVAELERELSGVRQQAEAARGAEDLLAATNAHVSDLEQQLAAAAAASAAELSTARTRVAELDHELFGMRQRAEAAETADAALATAQARNAELESEIAATRTAGSDRIQALELERNARVSELQQTQAQLASTTENLRAAYERLHQFEIAQALQQHQAQQAQPVAQHAWQA